MLLQAECNLLSICDLAWELLLGRDVCSMTREQRKAINIPQGDNDNRKPPGTAIADVMSRKVEDPHWDLWAVGFPAQDVCMDVKGAVPDATRDRGLLSQLNWQLLVGRDWSAYCRWIFFFMLLLCCSSVLQSSCWWDFSWDGAVARASLHLPSSTLLPATLCQLLHLADYQEFRLIGNLSWYHQLHQAVMLYHCPLKS